MLVGVVPVFVFARSRLRTADALILVGLSQFWLQAIYGLVILLAISADAIILRRIQRATAARRVR